MTIAGFVSGADVRHLMRKHGVTIRQISVAYRLSMSRVREVRKHGGPWDWPLMIAETATRYRTAHNSLLYAELVDFERARAAARFRGFAASATAAIEKCGNGVDMHPHEVY